MGRHPGLLFYTVQNKAQPNPKPEGPLAESCAVHWARGLPGLLAVGEAAEAEAGEEKHPGVCPELTLRGAGGAASSHICWVAPKLLS